MLNMASLIMSLTDISVSLSSLRYVALTTCLVSSKPSAFDHYFPKALSLSRTHTHTHTHIQKHTQTHSTQNNTEQSPRLTWPGFTKIRFEFMKIASPRSVV